MEPASRIGSAAERPAGGAGRRRQLLRFWPQNRKREDVFMLLAGRRGDGGRAGSAKSILTNQQNTDRRPTKPTTNKTINITA